MNLSFNAEQDELRASLRRFVAEKAPIEQTRHLAETGSGMDRELWTQMAKQLGLHGIAFPEDFGGSGFTAVELGIVFEEMGRMLVVSPFFSTIGLAANILLECDDQTAKAELLPGLSDGTTIATLALVEADGAFDPSAVRTCAASSAAGWARRRCSEDGGSAGCSGPGLRPSVPARRRSSATPSPSRSWDCPTTLRCHPARFSGRQNRRPS